MLMLSQVTEAVNSKAQEAAKFGDRAVIQILTKYRAREITSLASPEYLGSFSEKEFQTTLDNSKTALGTYISGEGSVQPLQSSGSDGKSTLKVKYTNNAIFEKGEAKVIMNLILVNKVWKIDSFALEPR